MENFKVSLKKSPDVCYCNTTEEVQMKGKVVYLCFIGSVQKQNLHPISCTSLLDLRKYFTQYDLVKSVFWTRRT